MLLSLSLTHVGIFSPQGSGCVSAACSFRRDAFAGNLPLPPTTPKLLWEAPGGDSYSCSADGGDHAICAGTAGTAAYNSSGRSWIMNGTGTPAPVQAPFLAPAEGIGGSIGGVMEACPTSEAGCRRIVLRSMGLGGIRFFDELTPTPTAVTAESLGPWVLPRIQGDKNEPNRSRVNEQLMDPAGNDGLLLVARGDGLIMAYNVELSLCWATRFLCLHPEIDECNAPSKGRLSVLGPPAFLETGGSAYFAAKSVAAPSQAATMPCSSLVVPPPLCTSLSAPTHTYTRTRA